MSADPFDPRLLRRENRQQLLSDILRNARGAPEVALTMGTALADMAGTGLGTLAGMAAQKLRGDDVDLDAAAEGMQEGRFTYQPRSKGGQETLRGLETVTAPIEKGMQWAGQKTADVTGSPALGAAVYTGLNVLDPQMLAPGAAKVAALRGASNVARGAAENAVPMGEALRNVPVGQRGAYTLEDLADVEGDFSFRSPTLSAFERLKPQEQGRVSGVQLRKALMREGAKKDELTWMGLDDILNSNELVQAADVQRLAGANAPQFDFRTARGGVPDDSDISDKAYELAREDSDLEYPIAIYRGTGRNRDFIEHVDTEREARRRINELKEEMYDSEREYYLENIEEHFDAEELANMSRAERERWADEAARESVDNNEEFEYESDYDEEPANLDSLVEYWEEQVRNNPSDYGLSGGGPAYGEYTVGGRGQEADANYTVRSGNLVRESRFGKGEGGDTPDFLRPYLQELTDPNTGDFLPAATEPADPNQMPLPLYTETAGQKVLTPRSKAFEIEALRRRNRELDPNAERYRESSNDTHYSELGDDQIFFRRETDEPAPPWGSTQRGIGITTDRPMTDVEGGELDSPSYRNPMRLVQEAQSDWLQRGRKTGWADPKDIEKALAQEVDEKGRVSAFQEQALAELPGQLEQGPIADYLSTGNVTPNVQTMLENYRSTIANPQNFDMGERLSAARNFFNAVYIDADIGSPVEALATQIRDGLDRLPTMTRSPLKDLTPSAPMRDTRKYTQLALADALRRAVQEGQQYLAWTPGDIHTKRWGTDSVRYGVDPQDPRKIHIATGYDRASSATGETVMQQLQKQAEGLENVSMQGDFIDLDSPDIDKELFRLVKDNLDYGMHEYPNPDVQRTKRAAALKEMFEKLSKQAMESGEFKASHYSPRAFGFDSAYSPMNQDIIDILRLSGVKQMPEIREVPPTGRSPRESQVPLLAFEIDPEVARAAKRGLVLPY